MGALYFAFALMKYQLSNAFNLSMFAVMIVYGIYAIFFYWLVFRAKGIRTSASS